MSKAIYDTKEGIKRKIKDLNGLNELIQERMQAGYDRREQLQEFYLLGRWNTDSCGNFGKISDEFVPKEHFPHIPDVLTRNEFFEFLGSQGLGSNKAVGISMHDDIPKAGLFCGECKKSWTIDDCHDIVVVRNTKVFSVVEFAGRQLWEVKRYYSTRNDALYQMQNDIMIRNDRFVDLRPNQKFETLKINERGWVSERDGITENYVIQSGDEAFFNVWHYYHKTCNRSKLTKDQEQEFRDIFIRAGFRELELEAIPNQYCSCERCAPWFKVTTAHGTFTIGWRKNVININWSGLNKDLLALFADENVTKDKSFIHAWGQENAVHYLERIRRKLD